MRSVFSAGLLDGFIDNGFKPFDVSIGVSAGAFNLLAFHANETQKGFDFFRRLSTDKDFFSFSRFIKGGHLLDLEYVDKLIFEDSSFNIQKAFDHSAPMYFTLTNVKTGKAEYLQADVDNYRQLLKASAALPLVYRDFPLINNTPMTDGGVANGIPVDKAIDLGATKIMVVRARHARYTKKDTLVHKYIRWQLNNHSSLVKTMRERIAIYNRSLALIRQPPAGVKIIEICPPQGFSIAKLSRSPAALDTGYQLGLVQAEQAIRQWNEYLPAA